MEGHKARRRISVQPVGVIEPETARAGRLTCRPAAAARIPER